MKNQNIFTLLINRLIPIVSTIGSVTLATDGGLLLHPNHNNQVSFIIRIGAESKTDIKESYRISIIAQIDVYELWTNSQAIICILKKSMFKDIMSVNVLGKTSYIYQVNAIVDINIYSEHAGEFDIDIVKSIIIDILNISTYLGKDSIYV